MKVKNEICKAFNTHAIHYEQTAKIQYEIGERLFERLQYLQIKPQYILDLGCGTGIFSSRLKKYYPGAVVVGVDLAHGMLKQARQKQSWRHRWPLVNGDMSALPFASGIFDLVFANQAIHWAQSMPHLMKELNRVMSKQGCLMFSTLGPDTFIELRQAWADIDQHAHTNEFMDMHDLGDCMLAEHFLDPVVDMEMLTAHYGSLQSLLRSLKAQGVRNINAQRNAGLTGKYVWRKFERAMTKTCVGEGQFPLSYEVIYGHAWRGEPRHQENTETMISVEQLRHTYHAEKNKKAENRFNLKSFT